MLFSWGRKRPGSPQPRPEGSRLNGQRRWADCRAIVGRIRRAGPGVPSSLRDGPQDWSRSSHFKGLGAKYCPFVPFAAREPESHTTKCTFSYQILWARGSGPCHCRARIQSFQDLAVPFAADFALPPHSAARRNSFATLARKLICRVAGEFTVAVKIGGQNAATRFGAGGPEAIARLCRPAALATPAGKPVFHPAVSCSKTLTQRAGLRPTPAEAHGHGRLGGNPPCCSPRVV